MSKIGKLIANGLGVSLQGDESILELDSNDVVQPYKYTKHYWVVHFRMMNFMVCESYLTKQKGDLSEKGVNVFVE